MSDRVLVAIAVARPAELAHVPGAIPSAKRLVAWGKTQGYDTALVTDADPQLPVTCKRLRDIFEEKLGAGGQERLIVAFMGHGLLRDGAQEFWLLNEWRTEATEAVNHFKLRERLATYQPRQLGMISDACRSLPNAKARYVEGNGVVPIKDYDPAGVNFADLFATQAAQPAYSEPLGENEAHCFFSRVLTDALTGRLPDAIETDPDHGRVVHNDALMRTVQRELPRLASRYDRTQQPDLRGAWWAPNNTWSRLDLISKLDPPRELPPPTPRRTFGLSASKARALILQNRSDQVAAQIAGVQRPFHLDSNTGLAVNSAAVDALVVGAGFMAERVERANWFHIKPSPWLESAPFLLRLGSGAWAGGAIVRGFVSTLTVGEDGIESVIMRRPEDQDSPAVDLVARMLTGQQMGSADEIEARLQDGGELNPMFAALAAYVLARAGGTGEIRRLLEAHGDARRPVPFDVALLARTPFVREAGGWTTRTSKGAIRVGGSFPWLRQGWSLLEDSRWDELRRLARFFQPGDMDHGLTSAPFTTFRPATGAEIAKLIEQGEL